MYSSPLLLQNEVFYMAEYILIMHVSIIFPLCTSSTFIVSPVADPGFQKRGGPQFLFIYFIFFVFAF